MSYVDYRGRYSVAECDRMASECLPLGERGFGSESNPPPEALVINEEWAVRTIGRLGMGNYGTDVLVGRTPRAKRIAWEGRVRKLTEGGVRRRTAEVCASAQWGMEIAPLVDDLLEIAAVVNQVGNSRASFERATGIDTGGYSMPRVWAAWEIARKLNPSI